MEIKGRPFRTWINQPSTHQTFHKLHGKNCIAMIPKGAEFIAEVFFTEGGIVSMRIPINVLATCPYRQEVKLFP